MLRIEIWSKGSIEWSLEGDGDAPQYRQAAIKLRSLFPDAEEVELVLGGNNVVKRVPLKDAIEEVKSLGGTQNLMLCDKKYEKMMMFVYGGRA